MLDILLNHVYNDGSSVKILSPCGDYIMSQQFLEVIKHFNEGGVVESKLKEGVEWSIDRQPKWNFEKYNYRKQPRVFFVVINKRKSIVMTSRDKTDPRLLKLVEAGCELVETVEKM